MSYFKMAYFNLKYNVVFSSTTRFNIRKKTRVNNKDIYEIDLGDCIRYFFLTNTTPYIIIILQDKYIIFNVVRDNYFPREFLDELLSGLIKSTNKRYTLLSFSMMKYVNCRTCEKIFLESAQTVIEQLNVKLPPQYKLNLDYNYNLKENSIVLIPGGDIDFNADDLLLCLFKDDTCVSSMVIAIINDIYDIDTITDTIVFEGFNIFLFSVLLIIANKLDERVIKISSIYLVNEDIIYEMIHTFNATVHPDIETSENAENVSIDDTTTLQEIQDIFEEEDGLAVFVVVSLTDENIVNAYSVFDVSAPPPSSSSSSSPPIVISKDIVSALEPTIILNPSNRYIPLTTYDFGSVRQENSFNRNFVEMETQNPNTSMILCLMMHGNFVPSPQNQVISGGFLLNKFSIAAAGQCAFSSIVVNRYIAYAMCDTVKKGSIIDVPTILREGEAHKVITHLRPEKKSVNTNTVFASIKPNLDQIYENELGRIGSNVHHTGKVGETNTKGNEFFEKIYLQDNERHGLILCKDWVEIRGVAMDNLLVNPLFIDFMNNRYEPTNYWSVGGINSPLKKKFYGKFVQLCKMVSSDMINEVFGIKTFNSRDLFVFCQKYGRTNLSLVDKSCSVFDGDGNGEDVKEYDRLSLHPGSAKGTRKGPRKGPRKGSRKIDKKKYKGKVKGSKKSKKKY